MRDRQEENNRFILIAIVVIIVIAILFSSISSNSIDDREEEIKRRNEEEARLIKELEELEKKRQIYIKHESINAFTEKYMNDLCEKRYRQLIQVLIILWLISNGIVYFTVPKTEIPVLVTWNGLALGVLNIMAIFFFTNVKKGKEYLKGKAMDYIEFRIYENRDKTYFTQKVEFYQNEIERIKSEIEDKSHQLNVIKSHG